MLYTLCLLFYIIIIDNAQYIYFKEDNKAKSILKIKKRSKE